MPFYELKTLSTTEQLGEFSDLAAVHKLGIFRKFPHLKPYIRETSAPTITAVKSPKTSNRWRVLFQDDGGGYQDLHAYYTKEAVAKFCETVCGLRKYKIVRVTKDAYHETDGPI